MQATYNLSEKELNIIIIDYFKRKGKIVKSSSFHKSQADRPFDNEYFYATVLAEESLESSTVMSILSKTN